MMKKRANRNEYVSAKRMKNKAMDKVALLILVPFFIIFFFGIVNAGIQAYHHVQDVQSESGTK
jgi:hypothetical protein